MILRSCVKHLYVTQGRIQENQCLIISYAKCASVWWSRNIEVISYNNFEVVSSILQQVLRTQRCVKLQWANHIHSLENSSWVYNNNEPLTFVETILTFQKKVDWWKNVWIICLILLEMGCKFGDLEVVIWMPVWRKDDKDFQIKTCDGFLRQMINSSSFL